MAYGARTDYLHPTDFERMSDRSVAVIRLGDGRREPNTSSWKKHLRWEKQLREAVESAGREFVPIHSLDRKLGHGFLETPAQAADVLRKLDPDVPLIVFITIWQFNNGFEFLLNHRGPILVVMNFDGSDPGLVGGLQHCGALESRGKPHSRLWDTDFTNPLFIARLRKWLNDGSIPYDRSHLTPLDSVPVPTRERGMGANLAGHLLQHNQSVVLIDEESMGMKTGLFGDDLLASVGIHKIRENGGTVLTLAKSIPHSLVNDTYAWLTDLDYGMWFDFGNDSKKHVSKKGIENQIRYAYALAWLYAKHDAIAVAIQHQLGLINNIEPSDLPEGLLKSVIDRPEFLDPNGKPINPGGPIHCINEADMGSGVDTVLLDYVHEAMGLSRATTLHDWRYMEPDLSGTTGKDLISGNISGSVPFDHLGGRQNAKGYRQPWKYFPIPGATLSGVSIPGVVIYSRVYLRGRQLWLDIGVGNVPWLPDSEITRRLNNVTPIWPLMVLDTPGVNREQWMAHHCSNHFQVVYAPSYTAAYRAVLVRAWMARSLGMHVNLLGVRHDGARWTEPLAL